MNVVTKRLFKFSQKMFFFLFIAKHDSSTASSHALDLDKIYAMDDFKDFTRSENGSRKPVEMIRSDGGPDEGARYPKVFQVVPFVLQKLGH